MTASYPPNYPTNYQYFINKTVPGFRLLIGDYDFTDLVTSFNMHRPKAEPSTPQSWDGEVVLDYSLERKTLSDLLPTKGGIWGIGVSPVKVYFFDELLATLRIAKTFFYAKPRRDRPLRRKIQLTDQLGLRNYRTPAKDWKGMDFRIVRGGTGTQAIVTRALNLAGLQAFIDGLPGAYEVPPNKFNESYIQFAQQRCGERGWWLYCDRDETVRSTSYPFDPKIQPLFVRSLDQVEDFEPVEGAEMPHELIRASGSVERLADCGGDTGNPQVIESWTTLGGVRALQRRDTITYLAKEADRITKRTATESALGVAMSEARPNDTTIRTVEITIETLNIDIPTGRIISESKVCDRLLGMALPDFYPGSDVLARAEQTNIEYHNLPLGLFGGSNDGVLRGKKTESRKIFGLMPGKPPGGGTTNQDPSYVMAVSEILIESWTQPNTAQVGLGTFKRPPCNDWTYRSTRQYREPIPKEVQENREIMSNTDNLAAMKADTDTKPNTNPPQWPTKEADNPVGTVNLYGECAIAPVDYSPYIQREFDVSASTLTTDDEMRAYACLIGNLQWQRYYSCFVVDALPYEWVMNPRPFSVVWIHDGAFVVDEPKVVIEKVQGGYKCEFGFVGNYLGAIPAIANPERPPLVVPKPFITHA